MPRSRRCKLCELPTKVHSRSLRHTQRKLERGNFIKALGLVAKKRDKGNKKPQIPVMEYDWP